MAFYGQGVERTILGFTAEKYEQIRAWSRAWKAIAKEYRAILVQMHSPVSELADWYEEDRTKVQRLEAEVARLREALDEIASGPCCQTRPDDFDDPCCDVMTARAALSNTNDGWLEQHDAEVRERCAGLADSEAQGCEKEADNYSPMGTLYHQWMNRAEGLRELAAAIREGADA